VPGVVVSGSAYGTIRPIGRRVFPGRVNGQRSVSNSVCAAQPHFRVHPADERRPGPCRL